MKLKWLKSKMLAVAVIGCRRMEMPDREVIKIYERNGALKWETTDGGRSGAAVVVR